MIFEALPERSLLDMAFRLLAQRDEARRMARHYYRLARGDAITAGFGSCWPAGCPHCGAALPGVRSGDCRCSAGCDIQEETLMEKNVAVSRETLAAHNQLRAERDRLAAELAKVNAQAAEGERLRVQVAVSRKWAARWKRAAWLFCDLWREERMFLRAADEENDDLIAELARWRRYTLDCVFEDYAASWKRLADSDSDSAAALRAWAERLEDK